MRGAVLATTALILTGLVFLYIETYKMVPPLLPGYPGDSFFPRIVLVFAVIWAVIILLRGLLLPHDAAAVGHEESHFPFDWREFAFVSAVILLFALLLVPVGFEITTVALMTVLLVPRLRVGTADLKQAVFQALGLSVATMLILYVGLGPLLKIHLPLAFLPLYIL